MDAKQRTDHGIVPKHAVIHLVETQMGGCDELWRLIGVRFLSKSKGTKHYSFQNNGQQLRCNKCNFFPFPQIKQA